jgi:hypothetical protein
MYSRLDDGLIDHRKVFVAGDLIGTNGPAIAIGFYAIGLMWTNKHLTDGFIPLSVVKRFRHVVRPLKVAQALAEATLWDSVDGGFQVHDFHQLNPTAADVKRKREDDRIRKEAARKANGRAHGIR